MRYAIFSDVHANWQAWEAVLADALQQGADTLVCLGDVVGYGPKPVEVLTAVREVTPNFVLGNHDAAACGRLDPSIFNDRARIVIEWTREQLDDEALQFFEHLPLQMDGSEIQFVHAEVMEPGEFGYVDGIGPAELNLKAMTRQLGFLGHTHLPLAFTMPRKGGQVMQLPPIDFDVERGRRYLVNVGSVGEPRTTDVRASYVVYDDVEMRVYFRKVPFDVDAYKADLAASGLDICPYFVQVVDAGKVAGAHPGRRDATGRRWCRGDRRATQDHLGGGDRRGRRSRAGLDWAGSDVCPQRGKDGGARSKGREPRCWTGKRKEQDRENLSHP
jgi:predicted phosphodiesterase